MSEFEENPFNEAYKSRRKYIYGLGINDANYHVRSMLNGKNTMCPYYRVWSSMMMRCFDKNFHKKYPTYSECKVFENWLVFSNFKSWMINQDWKRKQLDKDIIKPGNKIYSPDYCCFISSKVNSVLNNCGSRKGEHPQGVSFNKRDKVFRARISVNGKQKQIGQYKTSFEAESAYNKAKASNIKKLAMIQTDIRVENGLLKHANLILNGIKT